MITPLAPPTHFQMKRGNSYTGNSDKDKPVVDPEIEMNNFINIPNKIKASLIVDTYIYTS